MVDGPDLTIDEAAARLGVHYMTVYRYVRVGRLPAEYRDGRWHIAVADLERVGRRRRAGASSGGRPPRSATADGRRVSASLRGAADRLLERLLAGDGAGAWLIVESALLAGGPGDVYLEVLAPCLQEVGARWERGELSVGDEHRATAVAMGLVGRLGPLFGRRGRRRPGCVVLAGAEGDSHAIPLIMVADMLRAAGINVVQLGANVPVPTLVATTEAAGASVVGLSASTEATAANAARAIAAIHENLPGVRVVLGGPAVPTAEAAAALGADGWAKDAADAVDLFSGAGGAAGASGAVG